MILTTTNSIEGHHIIDYLGIVTGVAMNKKALGMGFSMSKYFKAVGDSID
ncbi:MAG: heavy metal-binding domain-containing protein, partial [Winogradskyella sp.]|nr:heavy metal-binding domain-containing protein [Winogradskyella sp.]